MVLEIWVIHFWVSYLFSPDIKHVTQIKLFYCRLVVGNLLQLLSGKMYVLAVTTSVRSRDVAC